MVQRLKYEKDFFPAFPLSKACKGDEKVTKRPGRYVSLTDCCTANGTSKKKKDE